MAQSAITEVIEFISHNPGFQANLGLVVSYSERETALCWGAIDGDDHFVPELSDYRRRWPDALWMPLSRDQARLFRDPEAAPSGAYPASLLTT